MSKRLLTLALLSLAAFTAYASEGVRRLSMQKDGVTTEISALDYGIIHIRKYPSGQPQRKSMVVDATQFTFSDYRVTQEQGEAFLSTGALTVSYDQSTGNIRFSDAKTGKVILRENGSRFVPVEVLNDKAYGIGQTFTLSADEAIYGLGQFQEGILNYRGRKANLVHANREIANPVLLSTGGYLIFWDNYSKTTFEDNADGATFSSEMGDGIDYYFVYGPDMEGAIAGFRQLTGQAPMLPKSAFGFWMSKERYRSFDELTGVVTEYRKRNIPLDNIVQDWQYWGQDLELWNSMEFDTVNFAHPAEVISGLHDQYHVKLTVSVWPAVGPKTQIYKDMQAAGVLFDVPTWAGYKVVDIYNPKARELYWDYLYRGLYSKGVDSWWMDATEPSFRDGLYQSKQEEWTKKAGMTYIGPFHRYLNTYSLVMSRMMYDNLRRVSDKRVSLLTRSAFAGQQKYSTSTWSGDIYASWDVLRKQIPAGLNLCMTGIPYWTTDIGAFRVKSTNRPGDTGAGEVSSYSEQPSSLDGGYRRGLEDPAYLELYTRWFQYAVFNPMFRAHGTEVPREIWHFGEPGTAYYDAQLKMIDLRYSLLSYIYSAAWDVTSSGGTMMRALAMDFTNDKKVYDNAAGYMFGDALLVYPVTRPMYHDREGELETKDENVGIYLPAHTGRWWYDLNSGRRYGAGQEISYRAPLDVIPVLVKGGSIVPRDKVDEYVGASDGKEIEIVVYPGADATFVLYEDDNETYDYEKGLYSTIEFRWSDATRTLTIGKRHGSFPGMVRERVFNISIADNDGYKGVKTLSYKGSKIKTKL